MKHYSNGQRNSIRVEDVIRLLEAVTQVRRVRDGWEVICPFHTDTNASMKVWNNGGWCCLGCDAKGNLSSLYEMLNGQQPKRTSNHSRTSSVTKGYQNIGTPIAEYIYRAESGAPLFKVVRFMPKSFRQMRWTENNWKWGLRDVRRVLYNLNLIHQYPGAMVVLVEGEKDADLLTRHGILATTCPMGAGKWRGEYGESLRSRTVILIPDNDEVGIKHMATIATYLNKNKIADARIVTIPSEYKDVSEWGEIEKIKEILR